MRLDKKDIHSRFQCASIAFTVNVAEDTLV